MNIRYFQRGPVWWLDVRDGGERKKVSSGKTTEAEARHVGPELALRALAALRSAPKSPTGDSPQAAPPKPKWTLKTAFAEAKRTRASWLQSKDPGSLQNTFNVLADSLGDDFPLDKLDYDFVLNLRSSWHAQAGKRAGTTTSPSTINGRLSMLSVLLEAARIRPHGVKHLSTEGKRRTRRMDQAEIERMQSWLLANSQRKGALVLLDMITVALWTGARAGELTSLRHGDIDLEGRLATLRETKNGQTRMVPFTEACKRIFEARRGAEGGPFMELGNRQRCALMTDMRVGLGLDDDEEFVFHVLRHEAASRMIASGISPSVVQSYMGHSSFNTTQIYVHNNAETLKQASAQREQHEALRNAPHVGTVQ